MAHPYKDKVSGGSATAKARYADGGRARVPQVATASADLEGTFDKDPEPGMLSHGPSRSYTPEAIYNRHGAGVADDARNVAAQRTRNTVTRKTGGAVKKADGGGIEEPIASKIARGVNTLRRGAGLPPNQGAISVQQNADMVAADKISDAVPRNGLTMEPARKSGGRLDKRARGGALTKKAQGGPVPDYEQEASNAKENLDSSMRVRDIKANKQFWDSGMRVPGRNAADNLKWEKSRGYKSLIVKD